MSKGRLKKELPTKISHKKTDNSEIHKMKVKRLLFLQVIVVNILECVFLDSLHIYHQKQPLFCFTILFSFSFLKKMLFKVNPVFFKGNLNIYLFQQNFLNNFQTAKEALSSATVQAAERAASSMKDLAQKSFRLLMDINLKAPVIIIPQSSVSPNAVIADLGLIRVENKFSLVPMERDSLPPVIDKMSIQLTQLKLSRYTYIIQLCTTSRNIILIKSFQGVKYSHSLWLSFLIFYNYKTMTIGFWSVVIVVHLMESSFCVTTFIMWLFPFYKNLLL